jgi:3-hydroxyisobutyrate dehydrogenase-like beta-hydroxyacid dehydrogenase/uncharacterized protein YgbK (DUF1537 family)
VHAQFDVDLPPERIVDDAELAAAVSRSRRVVILDDDPTGTQTIAELPVLTRWGADDVRWALRQPTSAFFVLTNTRSLAPADAEERTRQVAEACIEAAAAEGVPIAFASRSDSTLRGYFPLETDTVIDVARRAGEQVDGVIVVPAYLDAGRTTVDSVHWVRTKDGVVPAAESEFAKDASFGYRSSDLREWVAEKSGGRIPADSVARITIDDLRVGGPERVEQILGGLEAGGVVVVDAVAESDLRVLTLAIVGAEARGKRFVYRVGPSFVRARSGQPRRDAIADDRLAELVADGAGGLVVVGSHVALTTRQLARLEDDFAPPRFEIDVETLLGGDADAHLDDIAARVGDALASGTAVLNTSRVVVTAGDADRSLAIARTVSAAVVRVVRQVLARRRPAFVVAKGGITSSDVATEALGIERAWVRGTLLPGVVSMWEPESGPAAGIPYIVFAGNVGDDDGLRDVVARLSSAVDARRSHASTRPRVAVIGLGAMGLPMAKSLADQGFAVTGFDPFEERRTLLESHGAASATTPREAAERGDVLLIAVRDRTQAVEALFGADGAVAALAPGSIAVLTSTIGPDAAREIGARLAEAGVRLVDAPVSGGPIRAGKGDLLIMAGAPAADLAEARPVLDALASTLTVVGERSGDGQLLKTINQLLAGVHIAAAAEAIALARGVGLDPAVVVSALAEGAGSSFMFRDRGPRMVGGYTSEQEVLSRIDIFVKDMGIVAGIADEAHVRTPLAAAALELYREAESAGLGAKDDSSVVTILSPPTRTESATPPTEKDNDDH